MSKYILWCRGPKFAQQAGHEIKNWQIVKETDDINELYVAEIEAKKDWQYTRITQEILLEVRLI